MTTSEREFLELETGWGVIQKAITKLKNNLEGISEQQFTSEEYIMFYATVYKMCTQKPPHDYSRQLYLRYRETFIEYLASVVLPVLREKHDEFILRELVKRWQNHKIMVRWLSRFFNYLDRYFTAKNSLPGLDEVGRRCFHDLVYQEIKNNVRGAVINLIDREREGEQIDRALLKNVLSIFVEIRMGNMDAYEIDFESAMLEDTASYYSRKAASWILEDSWSDYMLKTEECLKRERERVAHYLHSSSEQKLLEKVRNELLSQYESQLLDKEHPGCHALLRDDKYVTGEGTSFVKHAEDAASNKKGEKKDVVGAQEQVCSTLEEFDIKDFGSGRVQRREVRRCLEGIHEGEMQREHDEGIHEEAMHGEHHEGAMEGEHHGVLHGI